MSDDEWRELNREAWDERVPIHVASDFYDNESFLAGRSTIRAFERPEVGDVSGKDLVHLQCHFGQDTLSWARLGASVTGLDFSAPAIEEATTLAGASGLDARFVCADVYDAPEVLGPESFDIVYTGLGALNWLPDIVRWGAVVASLLRPGGFAYLAEFHPITDVFADESLVVELDYFRHPEGDWWESGGTYADDGAVTRSNRTVEWTHPVADVVSSLLDAGLRLELLHEHDHTLFRRWPFLERDEQDRAYRPPAGTPRLPLMYSLRASRPTG
jgi:SAM-dependent methyltransferase